MLQSETNIDNYDLHGINRYYPRHDDFIKFHNRKNRVAVLVCHRRAGKTVACIADLVYSAILTQKKDARYAYIGPYKGQVKDVCWTYLKNLTSDIPNVKYNETELRVDFANGARIKLYGADNPDAIRGIYLDGVILDEYADMRASVYTSIIRPMLADRKGWIVFIGTPKGYNQFYKIYNDAKKDNNCFTLMLKASESKILDDDELQQMRKDIDDDNQYEQELECSFDAAIIGSYYGKAIQLLEETGKITSVPYDPDLPVYTAWDLGYSDYTTTWFFQIFRGESRYIDYYCNNGQDVEYYAKMLDEKKYNYAKIGNKPYLLLPHDAKHKTMAAKGKSIQQQFYEYGYDSRIIPSLSLQDGIQAARKNLKKAWFDAEKCEDGLNALKLYRQNFNDKLNRFNDAPLHDWTSHAADAFRCAAIAVNDDLKIQPQEKSTQEKMSMLQNIRVDISMPTFNDILKKNIRKIKNAY